MRFMPPGGILTAMPNAYPIVLPFKSHLTTCGAIELSVSPIFHVVRISQASEAGFKSSSSPEAYHRL